MPRSVVLVAEADPRFGHVRIFLPYFKGSILAYALLWYA